MKNHSRRKFMSQSALAGTSLGLAGILQSRTAPAAITGDGMRPSTTWGLQFGDVTADRAIVWARTDRPARMYVEWSTHADFRRCTTVRPVLVSTHSDFTGRVLLRELPTDAEIYVRVTFKALGRKYGASAPLLGRFKTAPRRSRDIRFVWGGDTAGQGWGIDLGQGGMTTYEQMRLTSPDFFIHSGDNIYADGPLSPEVADSNGNLIWRNDYLEEVPEKMKVAETLHEFRRNYLYNRYDEHLRNFTAEVPQIWQWDDHETVNNWSPTKVLDGRYTEKDIDVLVRNARRAFLEYSPNFFGLGDNEGRIYRHIPYGPDVDVFVLDMRTYRAGNSCNTQPEPGPDTAFLGREQIQWLKRKLRASRATWKIIAADMPIGLNVGDGFDSEANCPRWENSANGDGPVLGREFEIAHILNYIKRLHIGNVVWFTADVHYCAAHYYDPSVAQYSDFNPFWEFVSGPLHAGSFGPNSLDNTFGPTVIFEKAPPSGQANLPPSAGLQFFGQVDIDSVTKEMRVAFKDNSGVEVFSQTLSPGMIW